jgi:hypothetical protein
MNTLQNYGGLAFPQPQGTFNGTPYSSREVEGDSGMTLLDYFAGQALPAAIEWQRLCEKELIYRDGFVDIHDQPLLPDYDTGNEGIARCCYAIAEAMIAERNRI